MSCDNCDHCEKNGIVERITGTLAAVDRYVTLTRRVTWHFHSEYRALDIWVGKTHEGGNVEGKNAHIYKAYPAKGHVIVGVSISEIERAIREYLGEGSA